MEDAIKTLMAFFDAMNKWEVKWHKPYRKGHPAFQDEELMWSECNEIYEKFLTKRKTVRSRGHIGWPPEYDLNQESITFSRFINNKKISIETCWQHPTVDDYTNIHRFTLIYIKREWKVHTKEDFFEGKWTYQGF
jgi:hypothetical protein